MKFRTLIAATALAVGGVVACAPVEFAFSDGPTIANAFSGKTVVGTNAAGESYCEFHDKNGAVFGRDFEVYAGNWRATQNNFMCYTYPGQVEDCQRVLVTGNKVRLMTTFGALLHQGTLVDGNVCS